MSLETFALLRAEIERTSDRARVLADACLSPAEWTAIQRHWLRELAAEVAIGRKTLAERYCRAFEGRDEERAASHPTDSGGAPDPQVVVVPSYMTSTPPIAAPAPMFTLAPTPVPAPTPAPAPAHALRPGSTLSGVTPSALATPFHEGASPLAKPTDPTKVPQGLNTGTTPVFELPRELRILPFGGAKKPATETRPPASEGPPPASARPAEPVPEITVEQYAWLVAALRRLHERSEIDRAFTALHLRPSDQKPIEELWRARMAADGGLRERFLAALAQYTSGGAR